MPQFLNIPETTLDCFDIELDSTNFEEQEEERTIKEGLEYHYYLSSSTLVETDWRHDNQVAIGKQLMKFCNILIEAE